MPHVLLEYSDNLTPLPAFGPLFSDLHQALASTEAIRVEDIKSRAVAHKNVFVGAPADFGGGRFVALTLKLLDGRDVSIRQRLLQCCVRVLSAHFAAARAAGNCQLSVEVCEMQRSTYAKAWVDAPAP